MNITDCEKAMMCTALRWPETEDDVIQQMALSIGDDKFGNDGNAGHPIIWRVISELVYNNQLTTIDNVMIGLRKNGELDVVGGEVYLRSLYNFLPAIGVNTYKNWKQYLDIVHIGGSLRQFGLLVTEYAEHYKDFEKLVSSTADPEQYIFEFTTRIQKLFDAKAPTEGYKPIETAVDEEMQVLEDIDAGIVDMMLVGMPGIERYAIPYPRSFGVILGMRSMGKTQFGLQIVEGKANHIKESGMQGECTINSLETPGNLVVRRMGCSSAGIDSRKLRQGQLTQEEKERYKGALAYIRSLPIVYDDNPTLTTTQLTQRAIARHLRHRRVLGMSDYAELFGDTHRQSEEQRVSTIVKNVRNIAWTTGSCELLITQVNSAAKLSSSKIAGIDNARYSAVFAHAADFAIEVWNPVQLEKAQIEFQCPQQYTDDRAWAIVEKNKNGPLGHFGMWWEDTYTRLIDVQITQSLTEGTKRFDFTDAHDVPETTDEAWY